MAREKITPITIDWHDKDDVTVSLRLPRAIITALEQDAEENGASLDRQTALHIMGAMYIQDALSEYLGSEVYNTIAIQAVRDLSEDIEEFGL